MLGFVLSRHPFLVVTLCIVAVGLIDKVPS